jgi:hypothetical protein
MPINSKMSMVLKIQESNFDVMLLRVEQKIVLNWNLTPIYLPLLVEASLGHEPSNEVPSFRPGGDEKGVRGIGGGNKPAYAATKRYKYNSCSGNKCAGYSQKYH